MILRQILVLLFYFKTSLVVDPVGTERGLDLVQIQIQDCHQVDICKALSEVHEV